MSANLNAAALPPPLPLLPLPGKTEWREAKRLGRRLAALLRGWGGGEFECRRGSGMTDAAAVSAAHGLWLCPAALETALAALVARRTRLLAAASALPATGAVADVVMCPLEQRVVTGGWSAGTPGVGRAAAEVALGEARVLAALTADGTNPPTVAELVTVRSLPAPTRGSLMSRPRAVAGSRMRRWSSRLTACDVRSHCSAGRLCMRGHCQAVPALGIRVAAGLLSVASAKDPTNVARTAVPELFTGLAFQTGEAQARSTARRVLTLLAETAEEQLLDALAVPTAAPVAGATRRRKAPAAAAVVRASDQSKIL